MVGDVVGHGLHAAATMGRLRTAVYNFSALDLAPDELLSHLDELVAHIDHDEADGQGVTGATCLYAIYDPVSGRCTVARSGHPGPALVHPDGTVTFPDVPVSPPLGLGGSLPFETAELTVPEGSQLVLYTDGLIEDRDRDHDTGIEQLRTALADAVDRTPEATCQTVFATMLPERPRDDIALLVARTHLLDPARVADWEVPSDPAAVSRVRTDVTRQLETWGLDQVAFTTELIVSELVTNAIRYGTQPIRLRLLHDRNHLICEVTDGSSTSPPAAGGHHGRGRPRAVPRRSARPALGHPVRRPRQGHLDRTIPPRRRSRTRCRPRRQPVGSMDWHRAVTAVYSVTAQLLVRVPASRQR